MTCGRLRCTFMVMFYVALKKCVCVVLLWYGVQYSVDVCSTLSIIVWMCGMVSNVWLCGAAWMDSNFLFPTVREAAARGKFIKGDVK